MALPTYQKANLQVTLPGGAQGDAGLIASAQGKSSLAQRLSSFSDQLTSMSKQMAQTQASKDAVNDIHTRKEKITKINESPNLTEEQKKEERSRITEGAAKMFSGVYSRAYDNAASAAYSNQITLDAKIASDQAQLASGGDSESYAKQMRKFRDTTIPNAPTKETGIIAEMAISQYGSQGYKTLKLAEIRRDEERRKNTSTTTTTLQISDVGANIQEGDWINANVNMFKLQETMKDAVKNGWKTPQQAQLQIDIATEKGILSYAKDRFASGEMLDGEEFINKFRTGSADSEIPVEFFDIDREKVADRMEYLLGVAQKNADLKAKADQATTKEEANIIVGDGLKVYKNRKIPDNIDQIEMALPFASLAKQNEYRVTIAATDMIKPFNKLPLPEQQAIISSKLATREMSREEVDALNMAKSMLNERVQKAKEDPMALSFEEGFNEQRFVMNPMADLQEQAIGLQNRAIMQNTNKQEYGKGATALLTKTEIDAYSQWFLSPDTTTDDKLNFLEMIEGSIPNKSNSFYNQLLKKGANVVAYAGSLIKEGSRDVSYKMLKGQEVMKAVDNPQDIADLKEYALRSLGNATQNLGGAETGGPLDAILDSSVALYYGDVQEKGKLDKGAGGSQLKRMIQEATGGTHTRNEQSFFLPRGVTDDDIDAWIDELDPTSIPPALGMTAEQTVKFIQQNKMNSYGPGEYSIYQGKSTLKNLDGSIYTIKYNR